MPQPPQCAELLHVNALSYSREIGFVGNQCGEIVSLREKSIDILQLHALSLRIEEIDNWNPAAVEHSKDNVGPPANVLDRCYSVKRVR
jgi:hypothetical protein